MISPSSPIREVAVAPGAAAGTGVIEACVDLEIVVEFIVCSPPGVREQAVRTTRVRGTFAHIDSRVARHVTEGVLHHWASSEQLVEALLTNVNARMDSLSPHTGGVLVVVYAWAQWLSWGGWVL
jgi:hypothetical protein